MSEFIHLHTHSDYSLIESMMRIPDIYKQAQSYNMEAIALTDSGNLFGAMEFYNYAKEKAQDVKPIIGCETLICDADNNIHELVLLAKNNKGYHTLSGLLSQSVLNAQDEESNNKIIIPFNYLSNFLHERGKNLIALSSGVRGKVSSLLLQNKDKEALAAAREYATLFGEDNFYLEIQNHNYEEEKKLTKQIALLGKKLSLPLVATNNVYYTHLEDTSAHEIFLCIKNQRTLEEYKKLVKEKDANIFYLPGSGYHFKTAGEMKRAFSEYPEAISNSVKIAKMCNINFTNDKIHFPLFKVPVGESEISYLAKEARRRLIIKQGGDLNEEYEARLKYEIDVITKMGYASYFLIVADFIDEARKQKILVGPGRGSAAGSLVSYAIGITALDPIKHRLLFERFLNPERTNLPDVDIDFQDNRRGDIIDYCRQKYGAQKVAQIITYGKLKANAVFKDVARVFAMNYQAANEFSALIRKVIKTHKVSTLKEIYEKDSTIREAVSSGKQVSDTYQYAIRLEGLTRQTGIHAAGVIIADKNLSEYIPLTAYEDGSIITQFESYLLEEYCGLMKMDFLGLKTLTILAECTEWIKKHHNQNVQVDNLPPADTKTFDMLSAGKIVGIFQFDRMGKQIKDLKPDCLEDLTALNALNRPGASAWIPVYTAKKRKQAPIFSNAETEKNFKRLDKLTKKNKEMENILAPTNYVPIYQEQIMEIGKSYAGFSLGKADIMRRSIGKKKPQELLSVKNDFVNGAIEIGNEKSDAEFLFEKIITPFQNYGFNKSHAVCYASISYQTAFMKANYTIEFIVSLLNSEIGDKTSTSINKEKIQIYIEEAEAFSIKVQPTNINNSDVKFNIEGKNTIIYGLAAIKGIGITSASLIVKNRKHQLYASLTDFLKRNYDDSNKINKQVIESLLKAGAFTTLNVSSIKALKHYPKIIEKIEQETSLKTGGQMVLFAKSENQKDVNKTVNEDLELSFSASEHDSHQTEEEFQQLISDEEEVIGFSIRYNPVRQHIEILNAKTNFDANNQQSWINQQQVTLGALVTKVTNITTKNNKEMAFIEVTNGSGKIEVVLFPIDYQKVQEQKSNVLQVGNFVEIKGSLQVDNQHKGNSLIAKNFQLLDIKKDTNQQEHSVNNARSAPSNKPSPLPVPSLPNKGYCYIKLKSNLDKSDTVHLKKILQSQKEGNNPIVLVMDDGEKIIPSRALSIHYSDDLRKRLLEAHYVEDVYLAAKV